ncbi:MAG: alpha/beta fold hydrolase [Lachnospiraceae bacterium]|jgi:alpha-beta hydrolase superfamily lysophospholipase
MRTGERSLVSSTKLDQLYVKIWLPDQDPRVIVQISHGMMEYVDRYGDFASFLCENGIGAVGNDHLGHGKTAGGPSQYGYFAAHDGDQALVEDLHIVTKYIHRHYPQARVILLGHSMGSFLARVYMTKYSRDVSGVILSGTGHYSKATAQAGSFLAHTVRFFRGDFYRSSLLHNMVLGSFQKVYQDDEYPSWQTKDMKIQAEYDSCPADQFKFTASAYVDFFKILKYLAEGKNLDRIRKDLPVLIASGSGDPVGNYGKAVLQTADELKAAGLKDVTAKIYDGDRHEILNELDRKTVYRDFLDWIRKKTGT